MGVSIFNVRLDRISSREELEDRCRSFLDSHRTNSIFTPNPEILLRAKGDPGYAALLNGADLLLPDGVGILLVQSLRGEARVRRWPGVDSAEAVLDFAARRGGTVLLLGGKVGVARAAAMHLRKRWPALRIETVGEGVPFGRRGLAVKAEDEARIARRIAELEPQVVLVGLGAPKQELWISRHSGAFPTVRIMMGVGGALDMWAGRLPRAPKAVSSLGLEWLWRMVHEPSRLPRVLRATILFPWHALKDRRGG
jgi:N-acetylglucosaminyldiphosphoundecaprenol N-acetyl-beta-D-mannosaminyltransferase